MELFMKCRFVEELVMNNIKVSIAKDFSKTPGGRYIKEGDNSGEKFRNEILIPKFKQALKKHVKLEIDLDGCMGYPSSFLEESFGGLARMYPKENITNLLIFKSVDQPGLIQIITAMIQNGNKK